MKNQVRFIISLFLILIIVIFSILNVNTVAINFGFAKVHWPLIVVIIGTLIIGALIALLTTTATSLSDHRNKKQLQDEINQLKEQQNSLVKDAVTKSKQKLKTQYDNELYNKDQEITTLKKQLAKDDPSENTQDSK